MKLVHKITRVVLLFISLNINSLIAGTIYVPGDHYYIQDALNAAQSSDTVLVQPGTYWENIIWPEVNGIKLISAGDTSNTIINGLGIRSVIQIWPHAASIDTTTEINGFKITNGGTNSGEDIYGGGIYSINFDGSKLVSGIYIYKIQMGDFIDFKKMLLVK